MAKLDYYACLEISENATQAEVKRAYRRLVRNTHPDLNPEDPEATERLKEIVAAYEVLGDARRRARYDRINNLFGPRLRSREEVMEEKAFEWNHRPYGGHVRLNSIIHRRAQARKAVVGSFLLLIITCMLIALAVITDGFTHNPFRFTPVWRVNRYPLRYTGSEIADATEAADRSMQIVRIEEVSRTGASTCLRKFG